MQRSEGVLLLVSHDGPVEKRRTFKCNHCDGVRDWTVRGADNREQTNTFWCDTCDAHVCGPCVNEKRDHRCVVWERKMEIMEAKGRFIEDVFRCS